MDADEIQKANKSTAKAVQFFNEQNSDMVYEPVVVGNQNEKLIVQEYEVQPARAPQAQARQEDAFRRTVLGKCDAPGCTADAEKIYELSGLTTPLWKESFETQGPSSVAMGSMVTPRIRRLCIWHSASSDRWNVDRAQFERTQELLQAEADLERRLSQPKPTLYQVLLSRQFKAVDNTDGTVDIYYGDSQKFSSVTMAQYVNALQDNDDYLRSLDVQGIDIAGPKWPKVDE
jgi:hypothetical protein